MKFVRWMALVCIILLSLTVSGAVDDCSPGHEFSRRFINCIQSDCNGENIPNAHLSSVGYCVCGSSGAFNENPEHPNKECSRPSDYEGCPGCVYACVHHDEPCPGEEVETTSTTNAQDDFEDPFSDNPCLDPEWGMSPENIEKINAMPGGVSIIDLVDGKVEIRRWGESEWSPAEEKTILLPGDAIRTEPDSSVRLINKRILHKGDDLYISRDIQERELSERKAGNVEFVKRWGETVGMVYGITFDWSDFEVEEYKQDTEWVDEDSEICVGYDFLPEERGFVDLVKGALKVLTDGWKKGSIFSVKAGTTICGIRGSEVIIVHDPDTEKVGAYVLEGHMDVANTETGQVANLTDNQKLVLEKGVMGEVQPLSQKEWDNLVEDSGLESIDDESIESPETISGKIDDPLLWLIGGGLVFLGGIGIAAIILAIILLVIILWLWKRRKNNQLKQF